jgi:hypothetical protein
MAMLTGPIVLRETLREEDCREAAVHTHESVEKKIGRSSKGLALEQLFFLRESQARVDPG